MKMRIWIAALGMAAVAGAAFAQGEAITERRAGLKRMGGHMEAFKPVADAKGDVAALGPRVDDMIAWFRTMPTRFPEGSNTGDTKALPAIWSDRAGFEAANTRTLGLLETLKATTVSGDAAAFATAYAAVGPQGCGGCHRGYRAR